MSRRDGTEVRKERIHFIAKFIQAALFKNNGNPIPLNKTVAVLMYETGLRRDTIDEYMEIAENTDRFIIDRINDLIKKFEE